MQGYLRQSTASQSRLIGPFISSSDFITAQTGLTIANTDVKLRANGTTLSNKNSGGGTHQVNGCYSLTFDATDTANVGELFYSVVVSGALQVFGTYVVLEEAVYDAQYAASAPGYVVDQPVNVTKWNGTAVTTPDVAGSPKVTITSGTGAGQLNFSSGVVDSNIKQIDGQATNGNNATLNLKQLNIVNNAGSALIASATGSNGDGIAASGNGTGAGMRNTGGATGAGQRIIGGGTSGAAVQETNTSGDCHTVTAGGGNGTAVVYAGNGSAHGLGLVGGATGTGLRCLGGATSGAGILSTATSGNGAQFQGGTNGDGFATIGAGNGHGTSGTGGATGNGLTYTGGATTGHGISATAPTSGSGMNLAGGGTGDGMLATGGAGAGGDGIAAVAGGGVDLRANQTGNITGNLTGSVGSVTGAVGSVTGAVGSVTGNVGGNVTGSVGSVAAGGLTAASFAADAITSTGLAASAVNEIADGLLDRDMSVGTDSGSPTVRTPRQALRFNRNKWSIAAGTIVVTKEDDTTTSWTGSVTTTAGNPVSQIDPA